MTTGTVFNIERFCTDDGPGIRTSVFLKGCPLRCAWCHNPESHTKCREIAYDEKKCVACGRCVAVCSRKCHSLQQGHAFDRKDCVACGECVKVCPAKALELYGQVVSAEEVFNAVQRDKIFYQTSGGGVTVTGGEPLFQPKFTAELLRICRENGIHTAIETSGFANEQDFLSVIDGCDLVLFDIKETDEERHKRYTGVSFMPILRNLNLMNEREIPFFIRAPIIPGLNDRASHFDALKTLRTSMSSCQGVQIMPYHTIGVYKYGLLGKDYRCDTIQEPDKERVTAWRTLF